MPVTQYTEGYEGNDVVSDLRQYDVRNDKRPLSGLASGVMLNATDRRPVRSQPIAQLAFLNL